MFDDLLALKVETKRHLGVWLVTSQLSLLLHRPF